MMRYYELTYIVKPDIDDANLAALAEKVAGFVAAEEGKVLKTTQWGMRRLMYPIRKYRDGRYVFNLLEMTPDGISRMETRLKLTEDIIRYLLIRADDDLDISKLIAAGDAQAPAEAQPASDSVSAATPEPASAAS